jgi:hypothetical protein
MKKLSEDTQFLRWVEGLWLTLVIILTMALYAQVQHCEFLFDDLRLILNNPAIRLTELSVDGILAVVKGTRPVAMLSVALNYYFHGYNVAGYHLFNLVVHLLTGLVFYCFITVTLQLSGKNYSQKQIVVFSLAAVTLWLVHPVQTQSVSYIIQRMTLLAGFFFVLSMLCYVLGRLSGGWLRGLLYLSSGLSCLCAFGSKEMTITLPFFIFLYEWYFFRELSRLWLRKALVVFLLGCCATGGLVLLFPKIIPMGILSHGYSLYPFTMGQRLLTELRVVVYYLSLLIWPDPGRLNLDYDFPLSYSLLDPWPTMGSGILLSIMFFSVFRLAKKQRLYSFAILWFLGNLVIESTFIPLDLVMEHRLYLPSMMLIAAGVLFFCEKVSGSSLRLFCLILGVMMLSLGTYERNKVWQSPLALMTDTALKSPEKPRPAYNVACEYAKMGDIPQAVFWLRKSVSLAGFNRWDLLKNDQDLEKIRDSREFQQFYIEMVPDAFR